MSPFKKYLICIVGPTAVGKTAMGIEIAQLLQTEIISADSRQFYKELEIGTAKPSPSELTQAKHHLINTLSIDQNYDVGLFEKESLNIIAKVHSEKRYAVMVGGSGLFVDAVCKGLDELPRVESGIRDNLNIEFKNNGLEPLINELKESDIEYYEIVDLKNPQRIIRALEVIRSTGKKFSSFRNQNTKPRPFQILKIGLEMDREELYKRIDHRMDMMIEQGLFEEAEQFLEFRHLNALQTVGYQEIFPYLLGEYSKEEAIRLLKRNSRRYAKRQFTWFKKDSEIKWFNPKQTGEIKDYVLSQLERPEPKN